MVKLGYYLLFCNIYSFCIMIIFKKFFMKFFIVYLIFFFELFVYEIINNWICYIIYKV